MLEAGFTVEDCERTLAFFDHDDFVAVAGRERMNRFFAENRAVVAAAREES